MYLLDEPTSGPVTLKVSFGRCAFEAIAENGTALRSRAARGWDAGCAGRAAGRSGPGRRRSGSFGGSHRTAAGSTHHLAGLGDVAEVGGKIEQARLADVLERNPIILAHILLR